MSRAQPYYQRFPSDEFAETLELNCEEYGLFQRMRDYSWHKRGIPDSKDTFERLRKAFQVSRYKMKRLWPAIENFFTLRDGFYFYEPDEAKRLQVVDISDKRSKAGKLGADARWSAQYGTGAEGERIQDGTAMANAIHDAMANASAPEPYPDPNYYPPPPTTVVEGGGGEPPPVPPETTESTPISMDRTEAYKAVALRSMDLGMDIPGEDLARAVLKKFTGVPHAEVVKLLPRFPGQESPGLWASKTRAQLEAETARQQLEAGRKPASREEHKRRMLEEAQQVDLERRRAAGGGNPQ